jgi:hypothetical protein
MDGSEDDIGSMEGNHGVSPGFGLATIEGVITMRINASYITMLFAAGAGAVAIAAAPIAAAAPAPAPDAAVQSCSSTASGSVCQSPGDVELNDTTPPVSFDPYGGEEFLMGGYGGYHGFGGIHGGGGGHR